jgi:hypothetical protein
MLSKKQVEDMCLLYAGHKSCRYLIYDQETGKHLCCKKVQGLKNDIDNRIEMYLERVKKEGQDIAMLGRPLGDNCPGYLYLKSCLQGHDVPGSA